jgi:hypothetical protein
VVCGKYEDQELKDYWSTPQETKRPTENFTELTKGEENKMMNKQINKWKSTRNSSNYTNYKLNCPEPGAGRNQVPSTSYPKGYKDTKTLDFYIENYLFTMFCLENYNHYVINFITENLSRFLPSTTPQEEIKSPYNPLKYLTQEAREKNMYIVIDIYKKLFDFIILERGLIRHLDDLV